MNIIYTPYMIRDDDHLGCPFCGRVDVHPVFIQQTYIDCDDVTGEQISLKQFCIRCRACGSRGSINNSVSLAWAYWDRRCVPEKKE